MWVWYEANVPCFLRIIFCSSGEFPASVTYFDAVDLLRVLYSSYCIEIYKNIEYDHSIISLCSKKNVASVKKRSVVISEFIVRILISFVILLKLLHSEP